MPCVSRGQRGDNSKGSCWKEGECKGPVKGSWCCLGSQVAPRRGGKLSPSPSPELAPALKTLLTSQLPLRSEGVCHGRGAVICPGLCSEAGSQNLP